MPGETKVWQYVTLTKRVFLIDCPGVVYHRTADTDTDAVLKGVVRVENLDGDSVADHVEAVLQRVAPAALTRAYHISDWTGPEDFLARLARRSGRLTRGGEPDLATAAKMVLMDWQRGKLPYFTAPPGAEEEGAMAARKKKGKGGALILPAEAVTAADAEAEAGASAVAARAAAAAVVEGVAAVTAEQAAPGSALPQQVGFFGGEEKEEEEEEDVISEDEEEDGGDEEPSTSSGDESDGYGDAGLSWEAVMHAVRGGGEEEEDGDEEEKEEGAADEPPAPSRPTKRTKAGSEGKAKAKAPKAGRAKR